MSRSSKSVNNTRSQRGEGKLKAVIITVILAVAILAAWKMVPPYAAQYQLNDKITEIARFAVINHDSEDKIKDAVFKTMQDLEIPATREAIKVTSSPAKVTILVDYTIPVDILFYHIDLHFTPSTEGKSLTAS